MRKHVLIISAVFPPEQVTSAYLNYDLAKALAKDYKVTVLRPKPTRPIGATFQDDWSDADFETITLESYTHPHSDFLGRMKESVSFGKKCASYIEEYHDRIDFVYNDGWQFFGLYIVARVACKYKLPYIVPIQDIYPEGPFVEKKIPGIIKNLIIKLLLPIDRYYQKNAYRVRTISDEMKQYLSETRKIQPNKYVTVNNWQNDSDFLKEHPSRLADEKIIFAYAGSINVHANVSLMIKAFKKADIKNSEFRIYGGGNNKESCVELTKELGLHNVVFDMVTRDQIPYIQSQVDVLLLALPRGNGKLSLPSKLTSYMLSGKPVIASVDLDSTTAKIIKDNQCGYAVAPDDVDALADAMNKISLLGKEQIAEIGVNCKSYAKSNLTRDVNLKIVTEIIDAYFRNLSIS